MIKIGIVGWYGTETLGDMSIMDGILKVFRDLDKQLEVCLGSLFSFHSNRDILENYGLYSAGFEKLNFVVFDVRNMKEVKDMVKNLDILIFGGGPLMNLEELYPIMKVFRYSRHCNIPTIVMGCGIGPLHEREYVDAVEKIFRYSDVICLRDEQSVCVAKELYGNKYKYLCLGDPAVISIEDFKSSYKEHRGRTVVVNLREFPKSEYGSTGEFDDQCAAEVIRAVSDEFDSVIMVPMHTFDIGGDDRVYLSKIAGMVDRDNISVLSKPLSLDELYKTYSDAYGAVGMRYHSVVMQTILNGNNYIVNYTDPKIGKTIGFIIGENAFEFYEGRMCNLKNGDCLDADQIINILKSEKRFCHEQSSMKEEYVKTIRCLLKDKA